jgi:hypothetical protein
MNEGRGLVAEHFLDLDTGICLWLGAGVTKHLAMAIGGVVPDWNGITGELEAKAGIAAPSTASLSNPERLQTCVQVLGAPVFRQAISKGLYGQLCAALAGFAHRSRGRLDEPPAVAWQLVSLGWLANPIVNFNVETMTSYLVARPAGPCRILPYRIRHPPAMGVYQEQETSADFFRTIYHPHGAVNYSGEAVMTSAEYGAHNGSLAYLLSVAAAFENNLWIVGMSLDDDYLREHLRQHRNQINGVRWFDSAAQLRKYESWAKDARVTLVPVVWPEFWNTLADSVGRQVRWAGVMTAWSYVVTTAIQELIHDGAAAQSALKELAERLPDSPWARQLARATPKAGYGHVFDPGEGRRLLPEGFDAKAIADELEKAIDDAAQLVTQIQEVVGAKNDHMGRDVVSALENAKPKRPSIRYMGI